MQNMEAAQKRASFNILALNSDFKIGGQSKSTKPNTDETHNFGSKFQSLIHKWNYTLSTQYNVY